MPIDLQVVYPQETLKLSSIEEIYGCSPRLLLLRGPDFTAVSEVIINDVVSPLWWAQDPNTLLVRLPESEAKKDIASVDVISAQVSYSSSNVLRFRLGTMPRKVGGLLKLIQTYIKILLTTPGSDSWEPQSGGGLLDNLGQYDGRGIVGDLILANDRVVRQLVQKQSKDLSIPADERLISAKVLSANFDKGSGTIVANIKITNQLGQDGQANLAM